MIDHHSIFLLVSAFVAVIGLIVLIAVFKLNPFITLLLTSLALAVVTGMPLSTVIHLRPDWAGSWDTSPSSLRWARCSAK
jgi:H+/gluconate symporter-like permease